MFQKGPRMRQKLSVMTSVPLVPASSCFEAERCDQVIIFGLACSQMKGKKASMKAPRGIGDSEVGDEKEKRKSLMES